jgi:hypothetical protein
MKILILIRLVNFSFVGAPPTNILHVLCHPPVPTIAALCVSAYLEAPSNLTYSIWKASSLPVWQSKMLSVRGSGCIAPYFLDLSTSYK